MKATLLLKNISAICLLLFLAFTTEAQLTLERLDNIPITDNGSTVDNAWAGGFNAPQFSQIDLDGDGIKDLFAFERGYNGVVKTFINKGSSGVVDYEYAPKYRSAFPRMRNWVLLADYNCDGKEDIFTSVPAGIAIYRNDSDPVNGLQFTQVETLLQTNISPGNSSNLYVSSVDIPAIVDIDNDGDLDILTFIISGSTVEYHRNKSMENYGNCDSLEFNRADICWGKFSENPLDNKLTLGISCKPSNVFSYPEPANNARHAGSALLAFDGDGDGDKELVLGDLTFRNMVYVENGGTPNVAFMTSFDTLFPSNTTPVDIMIFPAAFHLDLNNDGLKDLLVAPNNPVGTENIHNVWYYENTGTSSVPVFTFVQDDFLQDEMIDVGSAANPTFFDYDSDGLMDIVVGNYGYWSGSGIYVSKFALFKNTGTNTAPAYDLFTDDLGGFSSLGLFAMKPTFGDIDGDNDQDMIVGDNEGELHLFVNSAGAGNPANFVLTQAIYKGIDVGNFATPQLFDVNRDGKLDLLVGERSGSINYYENIGTSTVADFSSVPSNDLFGGIDVMVPCCTGYSSPFMVADTNGDYIMYVGSEFGGINVYDNIDNNLNGVFNLFDSTNVYGLNANISVADISNDGKYELVYGEQVGGIGMLSYGTSIGINDNNNISDNNIHIYPNPANEELIVEFASTTKLSDIYIFDLLGQKIRQYSGIHSSIKFRIDTSDLTRGFYTLRVQSSSSLSSKPFLILH